MLNSDIFRRASPEACELACAVNQTLPTRVMNTEMLQTVFLPRSELCSLQSTMCCLNRSHMCQKLTVDFGWTSLDPDQTRAESKASNSESVEELTASHAIGGQQRLWMRWTDLGS